MKEKDFEKITNVIQEKLGKENSGLIMDDIGLLITDNVNVNKELKQKDDEIQKLKQDKENLLNVNANLFQQVSVGEEDVKEEKEEKKEPFDFRTAFDEYGNFKQ